MTPLDIAAQITLLAWNLEESNSDRLLIEPILQRCLELSGIKSVDSLKILKVQGKSIYGQLPAYPKASRVDVARLQANITQALATLEAPLVPQGATITTGPGWEPVTTTEAAIEFSDLVYQAPLNASQS